MVTAGVYLLMRTSPLIEYSSTVLILCLWIGAITTVFSSLIGLFQQDIKKVIAYSTMSQLGMMVIAVGLSSYNIALFHLVNHAFYKGLLFLGAGAVIHAVADNQDFRKYGGLRPFLPLTYSVMLIASLSLVAFPFMTGFYSKDFILESAYGQFYFSSAVVYFIATIGAMFTTLYSVKVLYLTFLTNPNGPLVNYKQVHEGDIFMSLPLIILAIFSIFFGYVTKDIFLGLASGFFSDNSLFIHPSHEIMLDTEFAVPTLFKLLPLILTISLCVISIVLSEFLPKILISFKFTRLGYSIFSFFNQRFLIELFYNKYVTGLILKLGGQTTKVIDKGSVELLGPYGLEKGLVNLSRNIASLDTGVITSYALYILVGLIFYMLIPYLYLADNSLLLLILFGLFTTVANNISTDIDNPAKPHKFINSPLQSSPRYFSINNVKKHFTLTNIIVGIIGLTVGCLFKFTGLSAGILIFLNLDPSQLNQSILSGFTVLVTKLGIKGVIEAILPDLPKSLAMDISSFLYPKPLAMDINRLLNPTTPPSNSGGGVGGGSASPNQNPGGSNPVQPQQNPVQPPQNPVQPPQNPVQPPQNPFLTPRNPIQPLVLVDRPDDLIAREIEWNSCNYDGEGFTVRNGCIFVDNSISSGNPILFLHNDGTPNRSTINKYYATKICRALEYHRDFIGQRYQLLPTLDPASKRWVYDFCGHQYPGRHRSHYKNSPDLRYNIQSFAL